MDYPDFSSFRKAVEDYLLAESRYVDEDIEANKLLSAEDKEEKGLLIRQAKLIGADGAVSVLYETPVNNTKLRPGDEVRIRKSGSEEGGRVAIVEENSIGRMSFTVSGRVLASMPADADIEVLEQNNLETLISVVRDIRDGAQGAKYLKILGGLEEPRKEARFGRITDFSDAEIPSSFNQSQRTAVHMAMRRPSIGFVQGTPGSGKTHLLAVIAKAYAMRQKDVVVIALTHQAVNNALNKILSLTDGVSVVKIGKKFKNIGLNEGVAQVETFRNYLSERKESDGFYGERGHVVGMTFQSALYNLAKMKSAFIPQVVLFDEAGQMPLTHAAAVGAFGCGSVVFIGDDAQMPPIYHERLSREPLSVSVFERIKSLYPGNGCVLDVTYRMNKTIAEYVNERYYKPRGIELKCSPLAAERRIDDPVIEFVVCSSPGATDENVPEAEAVVGLVDKYLRKEVPPERIAVITPYRRQVRMIYKLLVESRPEDKTYPIVDTVERLQGKDVDVIILSFSVDDEIYFYSQKSFLLNKNRLNVMFSRATSKVVIVSGQFVKDALTL